MNIFCDVNSGYGGLTSTIVGEIRDDYGNNLAMPIWAFEDIVDSEVGNYTRKNVQELNKSFFYNSVLGSSSCIVPVSISGIMEKY